MTDYNLSDDERVIPNKPATMGLFRHDLFHSLLHKAKTMANMGALIGQQEGSLDPLDPTALFTKPVTEQEVIPLPRLFINVIQCQWSQLGFIATPSRMDRKMYTVEQEFKELLKLPTMDALMANLA